MSLVLAILRKSPTNTPEVSLKDQEKRISDRIKEDIEKKILSSEASMVVVRDVCKGDDEAGRKNLLAAFDLLNNFPTHFEAAYCLNVDRFSRSYLGIKWLHENFLNGIPLRFVEGCPDIYEEDNELNHENYLFFFIQCGFAQWELLNIRKRTKRGRDKLRGTKEWTQKYAGRKKGSKNKNLK